MKKKKKGLFGHLALTGIKNNLKLYKPYILAATGITAMFYIIFSLSEAPFLMTIRGGDSAMIVLALGSIVIAVFAVIFMFYINSFLIRTRTKEFGLYNILGMSRRHIARIVAIETFIAAGISIIGGLLLGILFEKLAEILFARMIGEMADYNLSIDLFACGITAALFLIIFMLVMLRSMITIFKLKTIDLLRSENVGERPPKAKWLLTLVGMLLLGGAYYIAVVMAAPVQAFTMFFFAVVMVIIATYILFISGSVSMCRGLQHNKKYYYRSDHFVSLSSMVYRMKRNGAGLASICILSTMVLVMISSTSCLYFGKEASLTQRYPHEIEYYATFESGVEQSDMKEGQRVFMELVSETISDRGIRMSKLFDLTYSMNEVLLQDGVMVESDEIYNQSAFGNYNIWDIYFVSTEDYNRYTGKDLTLADNEAVFCMYHEKYPYSQITTPLGATYDIAFTVKDFYQFGDIASNIIPAAVFVTNTRPAISQYDYTNWIFGFDLDMNAEDEYKLYQDVLSVLPRSMYDGNDRMAYGYAYIMSESRYENRADFFGMYGGLFFLGITLSIVFICALVLILYYKQISEGYEDRARYEIMRKVGMSRDDIRRNVNSQMGSVFYLPLAAAVIHLAFSMPMVFSMLKLFSVTELPSLILTAVISVVIFGVIYTIVYRITSNSYYKLVS